MQLYLLEKRLKLHSVMFAKFCGLSSFPKPLNVFITCERVELTNNTELPVSVTESVAFSSGATQR